MMAEAAAMQRMMTVDEVARLMRVHPATVRRWIQRKHLRPVRVGTGTLRIAASELRRLGIAPDGDRDARR